MYEGYQRYAARRVPLKAVRYVKRTRPGTFRGRPVGPYQRRGYGSIARARGAAVTGEMKYFDCELNLAAVAACTTSWVAGTILDPTATVNIGDAAVNTPLCLFAPKVSAALNGRIGRKVKMLKCRLSGSIVIPVQTAQATTDAPMEVRLFLVMDKQTNAAQMTSAQLMQGAGDSTTTLNSMQNPNNFGRFKVLKEKRISLQNPNLAGSPTTGDMVQAGLSRTFKLSYRFKKPVEVHFNATNGGTVADIIDNSLHFIIGANFVTLGPTVAYYSRVAYKE